MDRGAAPAHRRRAVRMVLILLLAAVAGACAGSDRDTRPGGAPTAAAPSLRPGGTLTVALDDEPKNGFNYRTPAGNVASLGTIMRRVWPAVYITKPNLEVVLDTDVVTSAEITNAEPQTIVYRINPAATWSDGVPISADDFIYNWQVQQPGAVDVDGKPIEFVAPGEDVIHSVTGSPDGKTVTVVLKQRNAEWKSMFVRNLTPAHIAKQKGWNTGFKSFDPSVVIGGGPFRIDSYNPGRDLILVRNERYWGKQAVLDSIVFRFVPSAETFTSLRSGEVDIISPRFQTDLREQLAMLPDVESQTTTGQQAELLDFNLGNEFLSDTRVRQAFALSLDRKAIVDRTVGTFDPSIKTLNNRLFLTGQPGYVDTSGARYDRVDVAGARRLLETAGFTRGGDGIYVRDGKRLSLTIQTTAGDSLREGQIQLMQAQARDAGFDLQILPGVPASDVVGNLRRGAIDVASYAQNMSLFTTTTRATFGSGGGSNNNKYSNTSVDALYAQARQELDDAKRWEILSEVDRLLWADMPRLPLYQRPVMVAFRNSAANVVVNPAVGPTWNAEQWGIKAR